MTRWILRAVVLAPVLALSVVSISAQDAASPWPMDVPGFVPPEPGEHPRLLFRKSDLPALRARSKTPEGQALIARLKETLGGGDAMPQLKSPMTSAYGKAGGPKPSDTQLPEGAYSISHAAGFGLLYQLTGEARYAELGRQCFEWAFEGVRDRDREGRYAWSQPGGALRAGPALGWYALGYDLCYDGWDAQTRVKIAQAIQNYNQGRYMSLAELVRGSRHNPASNHWGMQVGGGAMAVLAIMNDPGVDMTKLAPLIDASEKAMIRNMADGFGDGGFFAEGDGTGSMASHIIFLTALQAWRNAGGIDFVTPRPNAQWMALKWLFLTVPRDGKMDFPSRGAYPHNIWARTDISGAGYFSIGYAAVQPAQRAAMLWFYNQHLAERDAKEGKPFDTVSPFPHHTVLSFVNWPFDVEPTNPAASVPRAYRDTKWHFYAFRNRWQDENDIVISQLLRTARGYMKADAEPTMTIWSFGKKQQWGSLPKQVTHWQTASDGSAIIGGQDKTWVAIDFSGSSGAAGLIVSTGPAASAGDQAIDAGGKTYHLKFLTADETPVATAEGDTVKVGTQSISHRDGKLVLGVFDVAAENSAAVSADAPGKPRPSTQATENPTAGDGNDDQGQGDDRTANRAKVRLQHAKTFLAAGKKADAKRILEQIVAEMPDTPAAAEAKAMLDDQPLFE